MRRKTFLLLLAIVTFAGLSFWVLISPGNPFTVALQAKISDTNAGIIVGPYPTETDLLMLQGAGVKTVVSLLDARLPYEGVLLAREKRMAEALGMKLLNFPLTSIMGAPVREEYNRTAAAAAKAAQEAEGKVYVHCYLGLHRAQSVKALLDASGASPATFGINPDRPLDKRLMERAEKEFNEAKYATAIETIARIQSPSLGAKLLNGWAHYRLDRIREAVVVFEEIVGTTPKQSEAHLGLAYCALRQGTLAAADREFSKTLDLEPENIEALVGMGLAKERQKQPADAALYFRKALHLDPSNTDAQDALRRTSRR